VTDCARCATPLEQGDLRCSVCALALPPAENVDAPVRAQVLRCTECGAAVAFSAEAQAPHCAFCGAVMAIEHPIDPIEAAELRVPFAVDRSAAEASLRGWLAKRGYFAPPQLSSEAIVESLHPLCWAGWIVNARAQVAWTADSDRGSRRSAWAPHSGQVAMTFDDIVIPASRGLRRHECRLLVPYYDLARAVPVDAEVPGETPAMVERFDAQRSAARRAVMTAIESTAKTRVEDVIPGRRFRNVHVACMLERQTTHRVALPAWVLAYRYRGAPYRAIIHGQRAEVVFGSSPIDRRKVARLAGLALAVIAGILAAVMLLGCGGGPPPPDAEDFGQHCMPSGPFAPLTGRVAVQGTLNVHVDSAGLIKSDSTTTILLGLDLVQTDTSLAVTAEVCSIAIPDVPLAGQELPIHFEIAQATLDSVGKVAASATLSSPDQSCADFQTAPIVVVLGAKLDPIATAPLPSADDNDVFVSCMPSPDTPCATATGTNCACDQEADGKPGSTVIAHNVPGLDLDEVYVTLRTTVSLHGAVWTSDLMRGVVDAQLDTGVLACRLLDGTPCSKVNVNTVKTLNPVVTQQPDNPSTFVTVRIPTTMTCADIVAEGPRLFPR